MTDFRLDYLKEAQACLRAFQKYKIEDPHYWAHLLGAIANATVASVPFSVVQALEEERVRQRVVREHLLEGLEG